MFVETQGKGHFVGINYYVHCPTTMWYGEGDDMWFIDGEKTPSLIGTGTEDFFNTSWCPKEAFSHPYFGYPRVNVALPEAPTKAQRAPKPFINHMDIHRWRDAWRKAKGNKATLWGNE